MNRIDLSVVVCSVDDRKYNGLKENIETEFGRLNVEFLRIQDAKSMSEGYNRGLKSAHADWVLFCHDDIRIVSDGALGHFCEACQMFDVWGVVGASKIVSGSWFDAGKPHIHGSVVQRTPTGYELQLFDSESRKNPNVRVIDGIFMVVRRSALDILLGFDETLSEGFHLYDLELSLRASVAGFNCGVASQILIAHDSLPISSASTEKKAEWLNAKQRFESKHKKYFDKWTPQSYDFMTIKLQEPRDAIRAYGDYNISRSIKEFRMREPTCT